MIWIIQIIWCQFLHTIVVLITRVMGHYHSQSVIDYPNTESSYQQGPDKPNIQFPDLRVRQVAIQIKNPQQKKCLVSIEQVLKL